MSNAKEGEEPLTTEESKGTKFTENINGGSTNLEQCNKLISINQQLTGEIEGLKDANKDFKILRNKLERDFNTKTIENEQLRDQIAGLQKMKKDLGNEVAQYKTTIQKLEKQKTGLSVKGNTSDNKKHFEGQDKNMEKEMHQLKLEKKNLNSLTRVLSEDKQKLSTEITYHQNEKQNMKEEYENKIKSQENELIDKQQKFEFFQKESDIEKSKNKKLNEELIEERKVAGEVEFVRRTLDEKSKIVKDLEEKIRRSETQPSPPSGSPGKTRFLHKSPKKEGGAAVKRLSSTQITEVTKLKHEKAELSNTIDLMNIANKQKIRENFQMLILIIFLAFCLFGFLLHIFVIYY